MGNSPANRYSSRTRIYGIRRRSDTCMFGWLRKQSPANSDLESSPSDTSLPGQGAPLDLSNDPSVSDEWMSLMEAYRCDQRKHEESPVPDNRMSLTETPGETVTASPDHPVAPPPVSEDWMSLIETLGETVTASPEQPVAPPPISDNGVSLMETPGKTLDASPQPLSTKPTSPAQTKAPSLAQACSMALTLTEHQKTQQLLSFTMALAILVKGGLSFSRIFGILTRQQGELLSTVIPKLEKSVTQDGEPLSKALARYPEIFSGQYLAMVEMGESTNLSRCLDRLCEQLKLQYIEGEPWEKNRPALALACRNLSDALETSGSESQALAWAARASSDGPVKFAMQDLEKQVLAGVSLAECKFPPVFTPLITGLVAAHNAIGTIPSAFKEMARILER